MHMYEGWFLVDIPRCTAEALPEHITERTRAMQQTMHTGYPQYASTIYRIDISRRDETRATDKH
jgi:hypothetical protein